MKVTRFRSVRDRAVVDSKRFRSVCDKLVVDSLRFCSKTSPDRVVVHSRNFFFLSAGDRQSRCRQLTRLLACT